MPNLYCRNTALPNIVGRIDYISSEHRQERLLASYDGAADLLGGHYWEHLANECQAAYEQANKKTRTVIDKKTGEPKVIELKCCQGRELMITLPNSLLKRMEAEEIAKTIAEEMGAKIGEPCAVGLHLKHFAAAEDNLHAHVVFGERHLLDQPEVKIADRNLFYNADGRRVYKKSEILDEDKQLLPGCSIIKKGEVYEQRLFGNADEKYAHRSWTKEVKTNVVLPLLNKELKGDIEIKEYDPSTGEIPYMHETKGLPEKQLADVRAFNALNKDFREKLHAGIIPLETALQIQAKVFASNTKTATLQAEMDAWREAEARKELEKEFQDAAELAAKQQAKKVALQAEKEARLQLVLIEIRQARIRFVVPAWEQTGRVMSFWESMEYWKEHDPYMYEDQLEAYGEWASWVELMGGEDRLLVRDMTMEGIPNMPPASAAEVLEELIRQYPDSDLIPVYMEKAEEERLNRWVKLAEELAATAGISKPEVQQMYTEAQKATPADMHRFWEQYRENKNLFWEEYKVKMQDIRQELDEAYRRRKKAKMFEWLGDPRNTRKSIIGLLIAIIYVSVRKETVAGIDIEIKKLKAQQQKLRAKAAEFKKASGTAVETLRDFEKTTSEYAESVMAMQNLADRIRGKHAPFLSPAPAPAPEELTASKQPAKQPAQDGYTDLADLIANAERRGAAEAGQRNRRNQADTFGGHGAL